MRNSEEDIPGGVKVSGRVYRCSSCGYTRYNTTGTQGPDGKIYKNHQCAPVVSHKSFSDDRVAKCQSCRHMVDGKCSQTGEQVIGLTIDPKKSCPIGSWPAVERTCPDCSYTFSDPKGAFSCPACPYEIKPEALERPRIDSMTFVMAADSQFESGLYMAAWSLLKHNDAKLVVYDLGLDICGNVCNQLREWGVEFAQPEIEIFPMKGWQLFNKPFYIRQAQRDYGNVVWLDCDAYYRDMSLLGSFPCGDAPLIPDHMGLRNQEFLYRNKDRFYEMGMPHPDKVWSKNRSPCTSLVAVNGDFPDWVNLWCERTRFAWTSQAIYHASYYDQGIAQDIIDFDLLDGSVWNYIDMLTAINPAKNRHFTPTDMQAGIDEMSEPRVFHFAGKWKPFKSWDASEINWGFPSGRDSRPNDSSATRSPFR